MGQSFASKAFPSSSNSRPFLSRKFPFLEFPGYMWLPQSGRSAYSPPLGEFSTWLTLSWGFCPFHLTRLWGYQIQRTDVPEASGWAARFDTWVVSDRLSSCFVSGFPDMHTELYACWAVPADIQHSLPLTLPMAICNIWGAKWEVLSIPGFGWVEDSQKYP